MLLRNKDRIDLIIYTKDGTFKYGNGMYLIDETLAHFNMSARVWELEYHQDFVLPIDRTINLSDVHKMASDLSVSDLDCAFNPANLEKFTESKVVEGMMSGAGLQEWLKQMKLWLMAGVIVAGAHFVVFLIKAGVFQSVTGVVPGLG